MNYIFGNIERLYPYGFIKKIDYEVLSLKNILKVSEDDTLLVSRVWSPLLIIFLLKKKRPLILQFADGLITQSNCRKKMNKRPFFLYEKIYADALYVRQPVWTLPEFINRNHINSVVENSSISCKKKITSITFLFGNDPLVGNTYEKILSDIEYIAGSIDLPLYISSGNRDFEKKIIRRVVRIKSVGAGRNIISNDNSTLVVTSPSTVGYDIMLMGGVVMTFQSLNCETMSMLFTKFDDDVISKNFGSVYASVKVLHDAIFLDVDIALFPKNKDICKPSIRDFIFQSKYLLSDLVCLMKGGWRR